MIVDLARRKRWKMMRKTKRIKGEEEQEEKERRTAIRVVCSALKRKQMWID